MINIFSKTDQSKVACYKKPFELGFRRDDFIQAFLDFGVCNFDTYETAIYNPGNKAVIDEFYQEMRDDRINDVDEIKTNRIKMFRLAESTNAILVHESLRDMLIEKGFGSDITFYDLKEAAI
ncbi:MAG: hypothetical protein JXR90_15000 [Spirochaetes bacterium]|nr:hypothetical protein [Spirochaetota bacterium]